MTRRWRITSPPRRGEFFPAPSPAPTAPLRFVAPSDARPRVSLAPRRGKFQPVPPTPATGPLGFIEPAGSRSRLLTRRRSTFYPVTSSAPRQSSPVATMLLSASQTGVHTSGAVTPTATMAMTANGPGSKQASGSSTATVLLAAILSGSKQATGSLTASMALAASLSAALKQATGSLTASMALAASLSGVSRANGSTVTASMLLTTGTSATRANGSSVTALMLLTADVNVQRVITAIATQILIRPAPSTTYELVAVARVMQPSGPPVFLEVDPIDWTGLSYTEELSKAPQLNAGCQISGLTEPVLQRLRKPAELPTELWLRRNGRLVFAGPLFTAQVQGESLTFNAQGALGYLRLMDVVADVVFANVDQFKVATGLIDQWQSLPYGNFGIDTSGIAPSGVLRDATYLAKELHNVGQRVEELGLRENGFDLWVDPSSRKLQLAYPQRGVDRSSGEDAIVFDERNITSPNVLMSVAPGDVGSEAFGTGTGGSTLYSTKANLNLRAQYGRSGITGTFDGVSEQATLDAHVQGLLDARAAALWVPGPDVRVTPDSDIGAYDVGDVVSYTLHSTLSAAGAFRLRKRTVTVSRTGQEAVSVGFV